MADADGMRGSRFGLPHVEEIESDGFDFRVGGKGFVWSYPERRPGKPRLIRTDIAVLFVGDEAEKQALLLGEPEAFFATSGYDGLPLVVLRLAQVHVARLKELVTDAWRMWAPDALVGDLAAVDHLSDADHWRFRRNSLLRRTGHRGDETPRRDWSPLRVRVPAGCGCRVPAAGSSASLLNKSVASTTTPSEAPSRCKASNGWRLASGRDWLPDDRRSLHWRVWPGYSARSTIPLKDPATAATCASAWSCDMEMSTWMRSRCGRGASICWDQSDDPRAWVPRSPVRL